MVEGHADRDIWPWPALVPVGEPGYMWHFSENDGRGRNGLRAYWHPSGPHWVYGQRRTVARKDLLAAKEALFRAHDWAGVKGLVESEEEGTQSPGASDARDELASYLRELRASLYRPVLRAGEIVEQLIDVWALAVEVDHEAARPAEALLWAMEGCDLVSAGQVSAACDQIEAVLSSPARCH
jgi:hypothetical protein